MVGRESLVLVIRCRGLVWEFWLWRRSFVLPYLRSLLCNRSVSSRVSQRLDPHLEDDTENAECWNYYTPLPP